MKYNRLTIVQEDVGRTKHHKKLCRCLCDCGTYVTKILAEVKSGHVKSCGCYNKELATKSIAYARSLISSRPGRVKGSNCIVELHGHASGGSTTPTYQSWRAMKQRCYCPKNKDYANYGGKGITVCTEWKDSFVQFLADMGVRPSKEYSLDRIDPTKDYCPSNCQWITKTENSRKGNVQRRERTEGRCSL